MTSIAWSFAAGLLTGASVALAVAVLVGAVTRRRRTLRQRDAYLRYAGYQRRDVRP